MRPQPRAFLALAVLVGLLLGAYACGNGTFSNPLPVYDPDAGSAATFDSSAPVEDGAVTDGAPSDAARDGAVADASAAKDAGDAASSTSSEAGATDASSSEDAGDAGTELEAGDTGG